MPEAASIAALKRTYSLFYLMLRGSKDMTIVHGARRVAPVMMRRLAAFERRVMRIESPLPRLTSLLPDTQAATPRPELTGDAIIEGLARMNEYMVLASAGCSEDMVNRYLLEKAHGIYASAFGLVRNTLRHSRPITLLTTARLCDWALQAPMWPFLLAGRNVVAMEELLPAWRLVVLAGQMAKQGVTAENIKARPDDVEKAIFGGLGWETPRDLALRVLATEPVHGQAVQTRLMLDRLCMAAAGRLASARFLWMPNLDSHAERLQAGISFFADDTLISHGGINGADSMQLALTLLDDTIADAVWASDTLDRPWMLSRCIAADSEILPLPLFVHRMNAMLGQATARRLLTAWSTA